MSRDLKEIFDLDQLRRAWGGSTQPLQGASPPPIEKVAKDGSPQRILEKLEAAIGEELDAQKSALCRPTIEAIRALLGLAESHELSKARKADLERHLDELEDLVDALSLPAPAVL